MKFFDKKLRAHLTNPRWSWGAISESSGDVYLSVWTDRFRRIKGKDFVRLTDSKVSGSRPGNLGYRERLEHVTRIRKGASCYCILCTVRDKRDSPRRMRDFNREELLVGGELIKHDGDWWLDDGGRKPVP